MTTQVKGINNGNKGGDQQPKLSSNKKRRAASYMLLPGIIPEIKNLASGRLGYLAYLIAMIYQIVRILPQNHPYTKPENIGRFSVRQAIAAAANNIQCNKNNIDQIIVFIAILIGLFLMVLQVISFLFFLFAGSAWAGGGGPTGSIFITQNQDADIAFYMIREIFGLPTMFGTLGSGGTGGGVTGVAAITSLHTALHKLFEFYNIAILIVAILVFLYYIVVVIGETAQTGSPFGQRFSKIYAPFRLVIAISLLVPLAYGFNGSQYIAFYAAKLGSSFATNGWLRFNAVVASTNPLGVESATLIAQPNTPDLSGLIETISVARTCKRAYEYKEILDIRAYFVDINGAPKDINAGGDAAYDALRADLLAKKEKGHGTIYFSTPIANYHSGPVKPYCGEIKVPIQQYDQASMNAVGAASPVEIERIYFKLVLDLWNDPEIDALAKRLAKAHLEDFDTPCAPDGLPGKCGLRYTPPRSWQKKIITQHNTDIETAIQAVFDALRGQVNYQIDQPILDTGWGGSGIWFNKIAQVNGTFVSAVINLPHMVKRPMVMEEVLKKKQEADSSFIDCKTYEPNISGDQKVDTVAAAIDDYHGLVLNETYQYWRCNRSGDTANFFWDSISSIFGLNGLFNIRDKITLADGSQSTIHPLASLSSLGKSLVDSSMNNMGMAMGASFGGGIFGTLLPHIGSSFKAASGMFVSIATIGLSIGFVLYYLLPILPFVYFFFAVGGWVKGLFEAMVGAPLWAVAHLRIDGEGLPGKSAISGYLLIFEIFLRPILTVIGLIGGLAIFTVMANTLNTIFDLAVLNVSGTDIGNIPADQRFSRAIVDKFFYTILYTMILYMMALSSFKMTTMVPNSILRWLGQSVETFNDKADDPIGNITQYSTIGTQKIAGSLGEGATQLGGGAGSALGDTAARFGFGTRPAGGGG